MVEFRQREMTNQKQLEPMGFGQSNEQVDKLDALTPDPSPVLDEPHFVKDKLGFHERR